MAKRVTLSEPLHDDERDLKTLLQRFIRKSQELEEKESHIVKQVELVQSAVVSLQGRQERAKPSEATSSSEPLRLDLQEIERETQEIRAETERIQKEVEQKREYNKRLKEEIERRNTLHGEVDEFITDRYMKNLDERSFGEKAIETRTKASGPDVAYDPGIEFFRQKLRKLKELETKLKREMELEAEEARQKKKAVTEKMNLLERETQIDRQLISRLKKKEGKK